MEGLAAMNLKAYRFATLFRLIFPVAQALGVHVVRNHFYDPVPDTRTLDDALWQRLSPLTGIQLHVDEQVQRLRDLSRRYQSEWQQFPLHPHPQAPKHTYHYANPFFGPVDADLLYAMLRETRPRRVVEVGSGFSSRVIAHAIRRNRSEDPTYTCQYLVVDPFPGAVTAQIPEITRLIRRPVQSMPFSFFALEAGDVLFIDSSHVLKIGSDVHYLYLSVLPELSPGVLIHIHDIFLPAEYPKAWVKRHYRFWNEQYLLQAFLMFNRDFRVVFANSYLHLYHAQELQRAFPAYRPDVHHPSSFWMQRI